MKKPFPIGSGFFCHWSHLRLPTLALPRSGSQGIFSAFRHPYAVLQLAIMCFEYDARNIRENEALVKPDKVWRLGYQAIS